MLTDMLSSNAPVTALELSRQVAEIVRSGTSGSLIEYTRATRVEPVVLVDMRAANLPGIEDVLNAGMNIFIGYYLQAVALSVNVGDVNVLRLLEKLNPNRDPVTSATNNNWGSLAASVESLGTHKGPMMLPFLGNRGGYSHEAMEDNTSGGVAANSVRLVNENANLSVGKLIEVEVESAGRKASFPINVRLIVNTIAPDTMTHVLTLDKKETSMVERYHKWRSGQISFIRDMIMCQDLIDAHKKALMDDVSGYYKSRLYSRRMNGLSAILSGNPSVATASSIFVMTSDTAAELEREMRGRLKNFKDREKLFESTYGMMMFVINPEWEQVTIYHRSIEEPTEVSLKEIQRSNKSKGPDIMDVLRAFQQNKSPTF